MSCLGGGMKQLVRGAVAVAFSLITTVALAYPDRPIHLVVPQPPGGALDLVGRMIAEKLKLALGQPVLVENRAGAAGMLGAEFVAKAAPDGYTLLLGGGGTHGANSAVYKKLRYDPEKDFAPITILIRAEWGLFVNAAFPAGTVRELIALARAQPGKLNYASFGQGSVNQLMMEQLMAMAGIDLVHVPYKGQVAAQIGVITNDAQLMIDGIGASSGHVKSGKMKMIAVGGASRSPLAPDVPTVSESGVPGFVASSNYAVYAPAGTPRDIVKTLNQELLSMLKQPDVRQRLISQAYEVIGSTPEELAEEVSREIRKWQQLVLERKLMFD